LGVVEQVFIVGRFQKRVDGYGHGTDLDGAEEALQKFGRVQQQKKNPLSRTHAEPAECIARAIGPLQQLLVTDPLVATFNRSLAASSFEDIPIHEMCGYIEHGGRTIKRVAISPSPARFEAPVRA
jgi:hypothetical protein